jgi:uncharacterized membrane protein (UPF0127 family)
MSATALRSLLAALAILLCAACRAEEPDPQALVDFPKTVVTLESTSGTHTIKAWIANNSAHRARGLMFVRSLAPDTGMLFVYAEDQFVSMWMKNTYIALDMLFLDHSGRIVNIAEHTEPLSLNTINSTAPVRGVLELPAGTVKRLGLRPGDRVHNAAFEL